MRSCVALWGQFLRLERARVWVWRGSARAGCVRVLMCAVPGASLFAMWLATPDIACAYLLAFYHAGLQAGSLGTMLLGPQH